MCGVICINWALFYKYYMIRITHNMVSHVKAMMERGMVMPISVCVPVEKQDMIFDSLHLLWEDRIGLDAAEFKSR